MAGTNSIQLGLRNSRERATGGFRSNLGWLSCVPGAGHSVGLAYGVRVGAILVADIEANGLLDSVDRVWCLCAQDAVTGESWSYGPDSLQEGLERLQAADIVVWHNGINYDVPALRKVLGWTPSDPLKSVRDTLIWAKLAYSDRENDDFRSDRQEVRSLAGGHSLDDWGVRLGVRKAKYEGGFDRFTPEMLEYCRQDVEVTATLYRHLLSLKVSERALQMEHEFAWETERMSQRGITVDVGKAYALLDSLTQQTDAISRDLREIIPAKISYGKKPEYYTVRWPNGSYAVYDTKGEADTERKAAGVKPKEWRIEPGPLRRIVDEFNPGSRKQIREVLYQRHGWTSPKLTDTGEKLLKEGGTFEELVLDYGSLSEEVLRGAPFKESEPLADYLMIDKLVGMVQRGENSWLKCTDPDGKMRHRLDSIGCATMRCAHSRSNVAQVPSVQLDGEGHPVLGLAGRYGWESRALFIPRTGYVMVGADLSAIEARLLAHFLAPYDGGAYIETVLHGDIHQLNVDSFGKYAGFAVPRSSSKTIYYGWSYGAGDAKLGTVAVECSPEAKEEYGARFRQHQTTKDDRQASYLAYKAIGRKIRIALERGIVGFDRLLESVKKAASRGYLAPLDGRRIPVRKEHAAINTLIQGSAAIVAKRWPLLTFPEVRRRGLDAHMLLHIHDEIQAEVIPQHAEEYTQLVLDAIRQTGEWYGLKIPLAGEAKLGLSWAQTH